MLTTDTVALRLGTTTRHTARLGRIFGVTKVKVGRVTKYVWVESEYKKAANLLKERVKGRGRFTLAQER